MSGDGFLSRNVNRAFAAVGSIGAEDADDAEEEAEADTPIDTNGTLYVYTSTFIPPPFIWGNLEVIATITTVYLLSIAICPVCQ